MSSDARTSEHREAVRQLFATRLEQLATASGFCLSENPIFGKDHVSVTHEEMTKLLEAADWSDIRAALLRYAMSRTSNKAQAQDLVQDAILVVHDTKRSPWDPAKYPDLKRYLMFIVRQLASHQWKGARRHRELLMDMEAHDDDADGEAPRKHHAGFEDVRPNPEEAVATRRLLVRRTALLRERVAAKPEPTTVLDLMEQGIDTAEDQRQASNLDMQVIRNARKVLFRHAEAVARELPEGAYDDDAIAADDAQLEEDEEVR